MKGLLALFSVLLLVTSTLVTSAQELACNPDCPETPFPPPTANVTITLPGGCVVKVYYSTRFACNTWHDLYIDRIETVNANDAFCTSYFTTSSTWLIMSQVTQLMLQLNPMGFPPLNNGDPCETNWRVVKGACWQKIYFDYGTAVSPYLLRFMQPCPGDVCCLDEYQVCIVDGVRIANIIPGGTQGTCLPNPKFVPGGQGCQTVCGSGPP